MRSAAPLLVLAGALVPCVPAAETCSVTVNVHGAGLAAVSDRISAWLTGSVDHAIELEAPVGAPVRTTKATSRSPASRDACCG